MGAFDPIKFDSSPIGSVIQSPINLEKVTNGKWIALDGRDCNRSDYPELSPYFPAGVFTSTARTLAGAPAYATIAADDTNYLATGVAGTTALQASADGVSWTASSTWGASTSWASIIRAGTRWVIAGSSGDATAPYVQNVNATAANTVPKANWTATTGGTTTTLTQGLAYSPSLGMTVLIPNAAGTSIYTLADGATAWTTQSHTTSRTKYAAVWTGKNFIVPTDGINIFLTSSDGVNWSEIVIGTPISSGMPNSICSDGNGTVVYTYISGASLTIGVSKDHGANWKMAYAPAFSKVRADTGTPNSSLFNLNIHYINGHFITGADKAGSSLVSADGLVWVTARILLGAGISPASSAVSLSYKSGVYCGLTSSSTAAITSTENMSKFFLPFTRTEAAGSSSAFDGSAVSYQEYIKARS